MARIERFEDIDGWKEARKLTRMVYAFTKREPVRRDFRFCDQIRGAAVSVMNNIAEGFESQSNRTFIRYLYQAKGSAGEVRSLLYVAFDQEYFNRDEFRELYDQATTGSLLIGGFINYLYSVPDKPPGQR